MYAKLFDVRQLVVLILGIFPFSLQAVAEPEKHALLIGVTTYQHGRMNETQLQYPEADALAVGELLKGSGYQVVTLLGPKATRDAISTELQKLSKQGTQDGAVIVGLFGHGVQYGEDAYFGPFNTGIRTVKDSNGDTLRDRNGRLLLEPDPATMTSMRSILDALTKCGAGNRLLLADCCREDPNAARGRAFGSNLKISDLPTRTAAMFACSANERAFEHSDWGHGAFTHAFLKRCRNGGKLTANALSAQLHDDVLEQVREVTHQQETQTVHSLLNGVVNLQLNTTASQVSLYPRGQQLSDGEARRRRQKARSEIGQLGSAEDTAYIRGKIDGPQALSFKLDDWNKDRIPFLRELAALDPIRDKALLERQSKIFLQALAGLDSSTRDSYSYLGDHEYGVGAPDAFTAIARWRGETYYAVTTQIRPVLALTTQEQRDRFIKPELKQDPSDKAILCSIRGDYEGAIQNLKDAGGSHLPYCVIAPTLLGNVDSALSLAQAMGLRYGEHEGLLLICDTLLDEGRAEEAAAIYADVDKSKPIGVLVGLIPVPLNCLNSGGTSIDSFELVAQIAGRLDDESAYRQVKQASDALAEEQNWSEQSKNAQKIRLRRVFIQGLVRDL
ncbi:MAG: caspase family protein [Planctomycetaceae bacterium]|nr:caspase family protein [Planctomycetaceae bacterium]